MSKLRLVLSFSGIIFVATACLPPDQILPPSDARFDDAAVVDTADLDSALSDIALADTGFQDAAASDTGTQDTRPNDLAEHDEDAGFEFDASSDDGAVAPTDGAMQIDSSTGLDVQGNTDAGFEDDANAASDASQAPDVEQPSDAAQATDVAPGLDVSIVPDSSANDTTVLDAAVADLLSNDVESSDTALSLDANVTDGATVDGSVNDAGQDDAARADANQADSTQDDAAVDPPVAVLSGVPAALTRTNAASIVVGGEGVTAYRYSLNAGPYSVEAVVSVSLEIAGLADGTYHLAVIGKNSAGLWQSEAEATTATWTVDTVGPETTLAGLPDAVTRDISISISVSGADLVTYDYTLTRDTQPYVALQGVNGAVSLYRTGLTEGAYHLVVTGYDLAGNPDPTPETYDWIIDRTAPETTVSGAPSGVTNQTSATVDVSGVDVVTYDWSVFRDGNIWHYGSGVPEANDINLTAMTEANYELNITARDVAGNNQVLSQVASWTVDLTPPDTVLSGLPADPNNDATLTVTVSGDDVVTYAWSLQRDGLEIASASGVDVATALAQSGLVEGVYELSVTGFDAAGNPDPNPATYQWTLDLTPPETVALGLPDDPTQATGALVDVGGLGAVSYDWQLSRDGVDSDSGFGASIDSDLALSALSDGRYQLTVTTFDLAGNTDPSPLIYQWTVDTIAPETVATGLPADPSNQTSLDVDVVDNDAALYSWSLTRDGSAVDGAGGVAVAQNIVLSALSDGDYVLQVICQDAAGNVDVTPLNHSWTIDTVGPETVVTGVPSAATKNTFIDVEVSGNDVVAFDYSVIFVATGSSVASAVAADVASSPDISLSNLALGEYQISIVGYDLAGNADPTPYVANWEVIEMGPVAQTSPLDGTALAPSQDIVLDFDEAAQPASLTVSGDLAAEIGATVWSLSDTRLTLSPSSSWSLGSSHSLVVTVQDLDGLANTQTFYFDVVTLAKTVYVRASDGVDSSERGSADQPYNSVAYALSQLSGVSPAAIHVAQGEYAQALVLADGVYLYGSFAADWSTRDRDLYPSHINDPVTTGGSEFFPIGSVTCRDVTANTAIDGFVISGPGGSYSAAVNASNNCLLHLRRDLLDAGQGTLSGRGLFVRGASGNAAQPTAIANDIVVTAPVSKTFAVDVVGYSSIELIDNTITLRDASQSFDLYGVHQGAVGVVSMFDNTIDIDGGLAVYGASRTGSSATVKLYVEAGNTFVMGQSAADTYAVRSPSYVRASTLQAGTCSNAGCDSYGVGIDLDNAVLGYEVSQSSIQVGSASDRAFAVSGIRYVDGNSIVLGSGWGALRGGVEVNYDYGVGTGCLAYNHCVGSNQFVDLSWNNAAVYIDSLGLPMVQDNDVDGLYDQSGTGVQFASGALSASGTIYVRNNRMGLSTPIAVGVLSTGLSSNNGVLVYVQGNDIVAQTGLKFELRSVIERNRIQASSVAILAARRAASLTSAIDDVTVRNNLLSGATGLRLQGTSWSTMSRLLFLYNTVYASDRGVDALSYSGVEVWNNIFMGSGSSTALYQSSQSGSFEMIWNNDFWDVATVVHLAAANSACGDSQDCQTVAEVETLYSTSALHNVAEDPVLLDSAGSDAQVATVLDNDWHLNSSTAATPSPCNVRMGAYNHSSAVSEDFDLAARTMTGEDCGTSNGSHYLLSMGAYEQDL